MEGQDPRVLGSGLNSADRNLRHQTSFVPGDLMFKVPTWPLNLALQSVREQPSHLARGSPLLVNERASRAGSQRAPPSGFRGSSCQLPLGKPRKVRGIRNHEKLHSPEDFKINK